MRGLLLICLALASTLALAKPVPDCPEGVEDALRAFGGKPAIEGDVVAAHCKSWPPAPDQVVAAVMAFRTETSDRNRRDWDVPAVLALLDAKTHRVLHGRRLTIGEDAATQVGSDSLMLDTANYDLRPGVRALGLRFRNEGRRPAAADGWWNDELMLLVPEGRALRPVFCQPLSAQTAVEGSLSYQRSGAIWEDARLTVAVGPRAATGWNDLVVTARLALAGAQDAQFDPTPHRSQHTFRHDGKAYKLLAKPAPFWAEYRCSLW